MKKIFSISLAFILLLSNVGFTMGTHFCGGLPVKSELMIGHSHLDCGMGEMERQDCGDDLQVKAKPCCENQYQTLEIEDDFKVSKASLDLSPVFVVAYIESFLNLAFSDSTKTQYVNYSPPLLLRDIPVLNQVFLI